MELSAINNNTTNFFVNSLIAFSILAAGLFILHFSYDDASAQYAYVLNIRDSIINSNVKPVANIDPRLMSKINAAAARGVGEEENITAVMTLARDRESTDMAAQDTKTETNLVHDL